MNEEKKIYVLENQRMTKELMEIKQLIMGFLSQAEGAKDEWIVNWEYLLMNGKIYLFKKRMIFIFINVKKYFWFFNKL